MDYFLSTSKQYICEVRGGLPSCIITISDKDLAPEWLDAVQYFNICYDVDTRGIPFVFESCLLDEDTGVCEPYSVFVACMAYFSYLRPSARGICFGAISAVGRSDKFSPMQIVELAREEQKYAQKILVEEQKIWL